MSEVETQFYTKTSDAWVAMLEDIAAAKISIDIEQYIFSIDSIGLQFLDLFQQKVKEGVKIRILCDAVGSWSLYRSTWPERLRDAGIEIKFFNPIRPWRVDLFTSNFFRDHRKLLIIDGTIGHIGGVGIQDNMSEWRDTHMRMIGPIVDDMVISYNAIWTRLGKKFFRHLKHHHVFLKKYNLLTNSPRIRHKHIYQALIANIRNARTYIYLTTPYFIPEIRFYRVLRLAAKRGVDVRLLVPQISDHLFVNHARESYFSLALKSGIRIFVYQPVMLHTKSAAIDDIWATTGSFNLDSLSFYFNHEANISSADPEFITTIKDHFFKDLTQCKEITYEEWVKRPLRKKILELLTWPFHAIM
jgi:cardiolipin synthase